MRCKALVKDGQVCGHLKSQHRPTANTQGTTTVLCETCVAVGLDFAGHEFDGEET